MSKIGPNLNNKALFAGKPNNTRAVNFREAMDQAKVTQAQQGQRNERVTFELETPELTANKMNPFAINLPGRPIADA